MGSKARTSVLIKRQRLGQRENETRLGDDALRERALRSAKDLVTALERLLRGRGGELGARRRKGAGAAPSIGPALAGSASQWELSGS